MNAKDFFYLMACLSFIIIIGGAIYEHLVLWPNAFAEVPRSLTVFQGDFKLTSENFWMPVHPVTMVLMITAWVLNRHTVRKHFILVPLVIYILILIVTFTYFVPELLSLVNMTYEDNVDQAANARAHQWEMLSIIRLIILVIASLILLTGLSKIEHTEKI